MSFDAGAFTKGLMAGYDTQTSIMANREKKALTSASAIVAGSEDYLNLKKDRDAMVNEAKGLVQELKLSDGTNAAFNKVYQMLEVNQNNKNRVQVVQDKLMQSGVSRFRMPQEKRRL
jgi:hypothetical protein